MPKKSDKPWHDISEESSFYGNDEERSLLEEQVRNDALKSSSSKSKTTQKSKSKAKPAIAMSSTDSDSDVEVISPPKERSSRGKGKEKASASKSTSTSKKTSSVKTSEAKGRGSAKDPEPASEPAKKSTRKRGRKEDPSSTDSDSDAFTPEPKKRSNPKKRKADSPQPAVSDSAPPPNKKPAQRAESPESTDSGSPSPSPSPPREPFPEETEEPEPYGDDASTEDPDESDPYESKYDDYYPDEADPVMRRPDVDLLRERRPNQSMSNLVASMPPSTANMHDTGPWIFVHNPHYRGPQPPNPSSFWVEASEDNMGGFGSSTPIRRLGGSFSSAENHRTQQFMERSILDLARREGIKTGKWLFFMAPDRVDYVWNVIAQATERGELGPSSKVATNDGSGKARMIAVYTYDFDDVADIRRVARKLVDLGLIKPYDRPIYYKTDAYTHLDINSGNAWGLKTSMYNSRDILAGGF
ncbi:uncharacterized protein LDX57_004555 [Aspergillus melleus]|uniref:uncharacterized protein n=1 Tax=Aspergillus melleus TaxID=138277 RepID=UPI001E8CA84C|nr:uncharacterized protein LDX57_004555 [Aspergillus melleus]KAH8426824.1 hypothetical protein LDX57_004555 [Aspergillus melleus]